MRLLTPEESLFSETLNDLRARFTQADDAELGSLAADLIQENNTLNKYISRTTLTTWIEAVRIMAEEDLAAENEDGDGDIEMS